MKNSYNNDYINDEYTKYTNNLDENIKNYIEERLIKQIKWYDSSARLKQTKYKRLVISSIIATSIIPILSLFTTYTIGVAFATIIAILSSTSSVLLSIANLCEFQKLWIQYRSNCEILKSILHRYFTGANEFLGKNGIVKKCAVKIYPKFDSIIFPLQSPQLPLIHFQNSVKVAEGALYNLDGILKMNIITTGD